MRPRHKSLLNRCATIDCDTIIPDYATHCRKCLGLWPEDVDNLPKRFDPK